MLSTPALYVFLLQAISNVLFSSNFLMSIWASPLLTDNQWIWLHQNSPYCHFILYLPEYFLLKVSDLSPEWPKSKKFDERVTSWILNAGKWRIRILKHCYLVKWDCTDQIADGTWQELGNGNDRSFLRKCVHLSRLCVRLNFAALSKRTMVLYHAKVKYIQLLTFPHLCK